MTDAWVISYCLLFLASLSYQLKQENFSPRLFFDVLAGLPLLAYLSSSEPFLPLVAFQIHALLLLGRWSRKANRDQTESLTKFAFSIILGNFLIVSHWLLMQPSGMFMLWPFGALANGAGLWYEALAAALAGVGCLLLLGIPPLQQGWFDLAETQSSCEQVRSDFHLRLSLVYGLWAYLPFMQETLSPALLELLAVTGIVGLFLARLSASVQMSVKRTFAYQASSISLGFWLILGMPSEHQGLQLGIWWTALILFAWGLWLVVDQRLRSQMKPRLSHPQWDDSILSPLSLRILKVMQVGDLIQAVVCLSLAWYTSRYAILLAMILYILGALSTFSDRAAFRPRKSSST